jgi:RHS repeat-associated protein
MTQSVPEQASGSQHSATPSTFAANAPTINLPKGGGAIRGIGEKFAANPVTGTGSMSVPIACSPGRSGFGPQLSLSYDSGAGNGPFGIGWNLSLPSITRKTDKGLPRYIDSKESDVFILSGSEDLVPELNDDGTRFEDRVSRPGVTIHRYRPRIEGLFARIERWTDEASGEISWRSISRDNVTTWYGKTGNSRIADPDDPTHVFSWLICSSRDDKGNAIIYEYAKENSQGIDLSQAHEHHRDKKSRTAGRYLKRICYGNKTSRLIERDPDDLSNLEWHFHVVFDYEEGHYSAVSQDGDDPHYVRARAKPPEPAAWAVRPDPFSSYRAGFEVRSYRRCRRVLMFHDFAELGVQPCLVRATEFDYDDFHYRQQYTTAQEAAHRGSTRLGSIILGVTQSGFVHSPTPLEPMRYLKRSLPPVEFEYSLARIDETVQGVEDVENLPAGVDGSTCRWVDLDGEGLSGTLTGQAGAWYYKRNVSALPIETQDGSLSVKARFEPLEQLPTMPSTAGLASGRQQFLDLAGDGQVDVVEMDSPTPGFFERTDGGAWEPHRSFRSLPNLSWNDPNLRFVDLTGDGHADVLITEQEAFTWYPSLGEAGFGPAMRMQQALDEEKGPRLVFADGSESIYLADLSGDGLTDLARIRNGEVCYWPNLGHCRWGKRVTMDNSPWFDFPDQFDHKRLRLADIDGSGTTDIIYLGASSIDIYRNQCGNRWADCEPLESFPHVDNLSSVTAVDLLGNGTACLVWSSPLPGDLRRPMRYVDLMGGQKPHLLIKTVNNLGAETRVHYAPSTHFYLKDRAEGKPWITKLPFPVHVVERVETYDHVSKNRFVTRYAYHHGYFDGAEREFRGFGMVEQWDTEEFEALAGVSSEPKAANFDEASHVPPVLTRTWFHTGAYLGRDHVSNFFAGLLGPNDIGEYYREPAWRTDDTEARKRVLDDTVLPSDLTAEEEPEACRALKGSMLRQEVYALDGNGTPEYPFGHPYTVTEQNFGLLRVQPRKGGNRHAVFFAHPREALSYHYERNPADPRISHTMTLEVDPRYGQVLKSLSIGYGRRASPLLGDDKAKQEQSLFTYTENDFTDAIDKPITDPKYDPDNYRTPLPCETRTYEVTGFRLGAKEVRFAFDTFVARDFKELHGLQEIGYHEPVDYAKKQKRSIEQVRTLYRPNDMGESQNDPLALLPRRALDSLALPGETYKLAFTFDLLDHVYARGGQMLLPSNASDLLEGGGGDKAGYVKLDGKWWIPSGRVFYSSDKARKLAQEQADARQHFFVPRRYRDPFHIEDSWETETFVDYDPYDLLVRETHDVVGNRVTVGKRRQADNTLEEDGNDYRVLQPRLMMDPNRNCSAVAFDALGLVAGTAVMGKPEDTPVQGDWLDANFKTDLTRTAIDAFYGAGDPHLPAPGLLRDATTRIVYDIDRFRRSRDANPQDPAKWQPVFAATMARETHASEGLRPEDLKIHLSFSYSDGFGREIQKKIQAERGKVPQRDAQGKIIVGNDGQPQMTAGEVSPRWVGSGWTVFNNKGKPVRQFEPFFSDTHKPDFDIRIGVSPVLFYDPVERVVATLHPNHTYEKVVFDPWRQASHDVNDTVKLDPRDDPDIQAYVEKRFAGEPGWKTWLQQRIANPHNPPPDSGGADPERDAAVRAHQHAGTPTIGHFDALGRTFLTVADNGKDRNGNPQKYETRVVLEIEGNQREVIDAKGRVVMRYDYDLLGNRNHQASMEAGERWMLNDVTGKPIRAWDSRGHNFATEYDRLRRPLRQKVHGTDAKQSDPRTLNQDLVFAKTEYGEDQPGAIALNLLTHVFRQYDGAGVVTNEAYDFKGNLLRSSRLVAPEYKEIIDWATAQPAGETFSSSTAYDALNRPTALVAPDKSVIRPAYSDANLLNALEANLRGADDITRFVTNIDYNAKGQRVLIEYGNGAETRYRYDPHTFRLIGLYTRRGAQFNEDCENPDPPPPEAVAAPELPPPGKHCGLQNLSYTYDPAGNITHIRDSAQDTIYFRNQRVEPSNDYLYDAIYRLIEATGREHLGQAAGGAAPAPKPSSYNDWTRCRLPHPGDGNAMGTYREIYSYDEVGNFREMAHRGADPTHEGWTRTYTYNEPSLLDKGAESNRLTSTSIDSIMEIYSEFVDDQHDGYDAHGNMLRMPQLQEMRWDFQDRLLMTQRQKINDEDEDGVAHHGERTWYVYDASGQRVRKVTDRATAGNQAPTRMKERIYVGGFEVYREYGGDGESIALERETLHVMDDKQHMALVETKTAKAGVLATLGSLFLSPKPLVRYQFGNHLGTACLELTDEAQVISYEEYTPYGSTSYQGVRQDIEVPARRYRYSGKERDEESGLYYYGARYYSPWRLGWTSCDPQGVVDGLNLYQAFRSNPTRYRDLTGHESVGQLIEQKALSAASEGRYVSGYLWSLADVTWSVFGAEGLSKVSSDPTKASAGDYLSATVEVASVIPVAKLAKGAKGLLAAKEVAPAAAREIAPVVAREALPTVAKEAVPAAAKEAAPEAAKAASGKAAKEPAASGLGEKLIKTEKKSELNVDVAVQEHRHKAKYRKGAGKDVESAHLVNSSSVTNITNYVRDKALTILLPHKQHTAFDRYWRNWARERWKGAKPGEKIEVTVAEWEKKCLIRPHSRYLSSADAPLTQ